MKKAFLVLAMTAGLLTSATGADECFDDTGWQQGPSDAWFVNWDRAVAESKKSGKPIFALSTGSDWCGWCKKLKKDVLTTDTFNDFAKKNLVLLYLDSPRKPLPEAQTLHNRTVCRELRLSGGVPCAAVFSADARRLGVLSGGGYTASNYVERLEKMLTEKGELPKGGQPSKIFTEGYVEPPKKAITWKYEVVGDGVVLGRGGKGFGPAIDGDAFGALVIPEKIDGKPVRGIGNSAFYGRSGLTSVTIPESVTNIGRSAFYNCSGLKSLTIPSGVSSIGGFAFFGCEGLTSLTLPKRMTSIGEFAFRSCSGLTSMTIPQGVKRIESATFLFCTGLKSVTIPASIESIRAGAFAHCDSLTAFSVDVSNPAFCSKNGMICSKDGTKLVVGVNGHVTIPDGVEVVECCAFDDLAGLLTVKMPASVRTVENDAFMGCNALKAFSVDASNPWFCSRNGLLCSKDGKTLVVGVNGDVTIPDGMTNIRPLAFHDFEGLKSIVIPDSVTSVGYRAFDGCGGLADRDGFVIVNGVLYGYVGRASSVKVPEGVTSIGGCAFYWRSALKSITFPSSVTNIGGSAFYCCKSLESLSIPSSVTHIGNGAFEHCTGLKSVTVLADGMSIEGGAFGGCKSLVDVDIKGSDVKIAKSAFRGDTPVGAKLPDLSKPVGPIHVVADKDEGKTGNKGSVVSQETKNAPVSESWQKGPSDTWFVKWDDAVAEAKKTKKPIFVLSTGSDWCGWCIRLRKNVLSKPEFEAFAKKNLVLLYLDSPSKTPLCAEQKKHNQEVSRKLTLGGGVPNASIVTAEGEKLGEISGGGLELDAYLQKLGEIIGNAGVTAVAVEAKVQKTAAAKQEKPAESIIKNYKLCYADSGEVASMLNQMFKDCAALGDERMGIVSVKMKPDALRGVEEFIESLDIRLMELKLGVKVFRVKDVGNIDAADAKLKAEPDDVEVAFAQSVVVRENCDFSVAGLFTMCGKSTAFKFSGHTRWNYNGGRASVNWKVVCSNESGMACALAGVQVVDGGNSATLGGCMVEERSGLFSFLCPSGVNTAYLFQLTLEDANQDQSTVKKMPDIRKSDESNRRIKQDEERLLDKADQDELEEKMLDEKSQEELKKLAAEVRAMVRAKKLAEADAAIKEMGASKSQVNTEPPPVANTEMKQAVPRQGLLGGGSLRARRLQRLQEAAAREAGRQAQAEQENAQREAERAEQRAQLQAIQEELKRVREAKTKDMEERK